MCEPPTPIVPTQAFGGGRIRAEPPPHRPVVFATITCFPCKRMHCCRCSIMAVGRHFTGSIGVASPAPEKLPRIQESISPRRRTPPVTHCWSWAVVPSCVPGCVLDYRAQALGDRRGGRANGSTRCCEEYISFIPPQIKELHSIAHVCVMTESSCKSSTL